MFSDRKKYGVKVIAILMALMMVTSIVPADLISLAVEEVTTTQPAETTTEKEAEETTEAVEVETTTQKAEGEQLTAKTETTTEKSTFDITVKVTDSGDNPISGARVTKGDEEKTTDEAGIAVFSGVEEGEMSVDVTKSGYESVTKTTIVDEDSVEVTVILYSIYTYEGEVVFPVGAGDDDEGYTVSVTGDDGSRPDVTIKNNSFEVALIENVEYTIIVSPIKDKLFSEVTKQNVQADDGEGTYELEYIEYSVYLGETKISTAVYGEKYEANLKEEGYVLSSETTVFSGGSNVDYEINNTDNNIISFIVEGTTVITPSYNYLITVTSGPNGAVGLNGTVIKNEENVPVLVKKGQTATYNILAAPGYRIDTVTFNDTELVKGNNSTTFVKNGSLSTAGSLLVNYVPANCYVDVVLKNSKMGKATLSREDWSVSVSAENETATDSFFVSIDDFNVETKEYTIVLNEEIIGKNHEIKIKPSSDFDVTYEEGKYIITTQNTDIDIEAEVIAKEYTIEYINPFVEMESEKYTVETEDFSIVPEKSVDGFVFLGWSHEVPQMISSADNVFTTFDCDANSGDLTLYAVYAIEKVNVTAKSLLTYNGEIKEAAYSLASKEENDNISSEYFGNDVDLFVDFGDADGDIITTVTATEGGSSRVVGAIADSETGLNKYVINGSESSATETEVSVEAKIELEVGESKFIYTTLTEAKFTVKQDSIAPSLDVSNKDKENNVIQLSDAHSGVFAVQYVFVDISEGAGNSAIEALLANVKNGAGTDELDSETIKNIKAELRLIDSWTNLSTEAQSTVTHEFTPNDSEYIIYRVIDNAGNDTYSSFDNTIPELQDVKYLYYDNSSVDAVSASEGSIYTNGKVTVTATIIDKYLFYRENGAEGNFGADLFITSYDGNNQKQSYKISADIFTKRWSLFYDKWDVAFNIDKKALIDAGLTDRELSFEIVAYDQAGNKSESYKFADKMVIETEVPEITVTYTYENHGNKAADVEINKGSVVYSNKNVTAKIVISGEFFDPYYDKETSAAVAEVFVNGNAYTCEFNKSQSEWVGLVELSEDGEYTIAVKATSQAGNKSEYAGGTVVIDTKVPDITVDIEALANSYDVVDNDDNRNVYYGVNYGDAANSVKITVKDEYLAPFNGSDINDASTVEASLAGTGAVSANEKEISKTSGEEKFEYDAQSGAYTATVAVYEEEGSYNLVVKATDEAGNEAVTTVYLHSDKTAARITNVTIEPKEDGLISELARKLSLDFGTFFNEEVILTVSCDDGSESYSSGEQKVILHTDDGDYEYAVAGKKAVIELPLEKINGWKSDLAVSVVDNVNNASEEIDLSAVNEDDDILSDYVLYETDKPVVTSPFDSDDADTFYVETNETEKVYWLLKDKSITFNVSDVVSDAVSYSGLDMVAVELNGVSKVHAYIERKDDDSHKIMTASDSYTYDYDDFVEGKNEIVISGSDNAGNRIDTVTYIVYKDVEVTSLTGLDLVAGGAESAGQNLKFGNFYNGNAALNIAAVDNGFSSGIASIKAEFVMKNGESVALIKEASEGEVEEKSYITGENVEFERKFVLDCIENAEGYFTIEIIDNVGNVYTYGTENGAVEIEGNMYINYLMFDKTPSEIALSASEAVYECDSSETGKTSWYNTDDITVKSDVTDIVGDNAVSGITKFEMSLNSEVAIGKELGEELSDTEKTLTDKSEINLSACGEGGKLKAVDGENIIKVAVTDNAMNFVTDELRVYVDRVAPEISAFSFKQVGTSDEYATGRCSTVTVTDYGYFFAEDTEVTVYAKDNCPSSGIKEIHFAAIPAYDEYNGLTLTKIINKVDTDCATECKFKDSTQDGSTQNTYATFVVPAGFKGQIYAYVLDNVDNTSLVGGAEDYENWSHPNGLIVETQQMHDSHDSLAKHITIAEKSTPVRYLDGDKNPLYNDNAEVTITVIDTFSGIKSVEYSVEAAYDTGKNYGETLTGITTGGAMLSGWEYSTELNLVTTMRKTITVSNNSNDILVKVKMTDNSGNVSEDEFILSIDKDAPVIKVTFDKNESDDDETYTGFFNSDRRMSISITERNFDPEQVLITASKDLAIYNIGCNSLSNYSYGPSDKTVDGEKIQNFEYVLVHDFAEDGDYTFAIEANDLANNKTTDDNVNYGSSSTKQVAKQFTIDKTAPVITVAISGQGGEDSFYSADLAFTVTVEEHNFAEDRYTPVFVVKKPVTGEEISIDIPAPSESSEGDVHTFTYSFTEEYTYELQSVTVIDKAGNNTKDENLYTASLDLTEPDIQITYSASDSKGGTIASNVALDKVATKAAVFTPSIKISDAFLNTSSSDYYSIELLGNYNGDVLQTRKGDVGYSVSAESDTANNLYISTIDFQNFAAKEEMDDIYTLRVVATDQAGRTAEKNVIFSINRFGSTFMVDNATGELLGKYYTNSVENVKLIQINAAEIEDGEVKKTHNQAPIDLVEGKDYKETKSSPSNVDGGSGTSTNWYECVYDIDDANFEEEGAYGIAVYSVDSADNVISSLVSKRTINVFADNKIDYSEIEKDKAPINFHVDKTKPTTSISGAEDKDQFFSGSQDIIFYANDDVKLKYVELYVTNDKSLSWEQLTPVETANAEKIKEGVKYSLKAGEGDGMNYITVVAVDMAGNTSEIETISVQVTTNPVQWLLKNTVAKMITVTLLLAAVAVIVILIMRKKKSIV